MNLFHSFVRWGLGIHGVIHLVEFVLNLFEGAWMSAIFTFVAGFLMLSGAVIDYQHHEEET
tara:strand:+ start:261 stop:443 length:183 start_codon:yes stop_codon:yes gene_type:complete